MRVGYYIHHSALKAGGIFTYSIGILKILLDSSEIERIELIIDKSQVDYFRSFSDSKKLKINIINRQNPVVKFRFGISYFLFDIYTLYNENKNVNSKLGLIKKISLWLNPYRKFITPDKIDIFHVPLQYSPIYGGKIPVIITMHDLQEFHFPEFFDASERLHRAINNKKAIFESDHIIVSFNHIKYDLLKYFNIKKEKISVCPPPFATEWFATKDVTSKDILIKKYGLDEKFLLYPAATWQHKNHINLIKALAKLKKEGLKVQLICTGNKTEYIDKIYDEINKHQLTEQVKFLGIIPESDLIGLYKNTALVVIPTLYEAGSGPLYEAMRYEAPVICSNVTSLPETMGTEEFLFDPFNVDEMSDLIKKMLKDEDFREKNIRNSRERMNFFASLPYSKNFIDSYKKLSTNY